MLARELLSGIRIFDSARRGCEASTRDITSFPTLTFGWNDTGALTPTPTCPINGFGKQAQFQGSGESLMTQFQPTVFMRNKPTCSAKRAGLGKGVVAQN